jgi:hypothetical protein
MGFFKGIGKFIKKNVNIKTAIKGVGQAGSLIPGVGGVVAGTIGQLQDAHYAKKEQRQAEANALVEQAAQNLGSAGGTIAGQFASKTLQNAYANASDEVKAGLGKVGANVADHTIKEWFKKHWKLVVGLGLGIPLIIVAIVKFSRRGSRTASRRR